MPKIVLLQDLDQIAILIGQYPDGIGIESITRIAGAEFTRRTLQRRLATLIAQKRVITEGEGRAIKYRLAPNIADVIASAQAQSTLAVFEVYVPISPEGVEIKTYVRQPVQQRKPISY
jgi:hypothetical protein